MDSFRDVALAYIAGREICHDYKVFLLSVARRMAEADLSLTNVTPQKFDAWIASIPRSAVTRKNVRRQALTLLKAGMKPSAWGEFIQQSRKVKTQKKIPVAWSQDELRQLIETASSLKGCFHRSKCPARLYFTAWVLLGYETGLRFSDQMSLKASQLRGDRLFVIQSKTGNPIGKRLSLQCLELIMQLIHLSPDGTIFSWAINETNVRKRWQRLIASAGLQGTPKFLRRSGATYVEAQQPGAATIFLGHRSPELAEANYIDPTLLPDRSPKPPPLFPLSRSGADSPALASS